MYMYMCVIYDTNSGLTPSFFPPILKTQNKNKKSLKEDKQRKIQPLTEIKQKIKTKINGDRGEANAKNYKKINKIKPQ